jgi:hypothetical protein
MTSRRSRTVPIHSLLFLHLTGWLGEDGRPLVGEYGRLVAIVTAAAPEKRDGDHGNESEDRPPQGSRK